MANHYETFYENYKIMLLYASSQRAYLHIRNHFHTIIIDNSVSKQQPHAFKIFSSEHFGIEVQFAFSRFSVSKKIDTKTSIDNSWQIARRYNNREIQISIKRVSTKTQKIALITYYNIFLRESPRVKNWKSLSFVLQNLLLFLRNICRLSSQLHFKSVAVPSTTGPIKDL